jgi:hypothetical protein
MKRRVLCLLVLLLSSFSSFAQEQPKQKDLPVIGDISSIKTFTKVYIAAESTDAYKLIKKELGKYKALEVVNDASDAEFILEYRVLDKQDKSDIIGRRYVERAEMKAYFYSEGKTIIAWSDTETYEELSGAVANRLNEINLTRNSQYRTKKDE